MSRHSVLSLPMGSCRPACQIAPAGAIRAGSVPPCSSLSPPLPTRGCLPQRPKSNVIRAGLATGWWALMMTSFSSDMNSDLVKAYNIVLRVGGREEGLGAEKHSVARAAFGAGSGASELAAARVCDH